MSGLVFGPVTSRRFGISLGVDLSPQRKQCNFDCLYCELSPAKPVSSIDGSPLPDAYIKAILDGLEQYPKTEFITLTANGEPTLYPYLNELVDKIKALHVKQKLLILSNGSTIINPEIVSVLHKIDVVKLSLDAVSQKIFKRIDRPIKGLHVNEIIDALERFSGEYKGELVLEVLVVSGVNDSTEEFEKINQIITSINPTRVDVGTIARPPAYRVQGVSKECLERLARMISNVPVTIPWSAEYKEIYDFEKDALLELLKKRPQNKNDVELSFSKKSQALLEDLVLSKEAYIQNVAGVEFYRA